jgi:hypothetical protein
MLSRASCWEYTDASRWTFPRTRSVTQEPDTALLARAPFQAARPWGETGEYPGMLESTPDLAGDLSHRRLAPVAAKAARAASRATARSACRPLSSSLRRVGSRSGEAMHSDQAGFESLHNEFAERLLPVLDTRGNRFP